MTHTHTPKTNKTIFGNTLKECSCGARKWSDGRSITGGTLDTDGWYVAKVIDPEAEAAHAYEMLQTEGYGYGTEAHDPLDSHMPNID